MRETAGTMRDILSKIFKDLNVPLRFCATAFMVSHSIFFAVSISTTAFAGNRTEVASWLDSRNNQEWRLLATSATWQDARKICRDANMRLPRIELLQDVQSTLLNVSVGQKALEVSELAWSVESWTEPSLSKPTAVAMSLRSGENTSVDRGNLLPVICVRDLPLR